MNNCNRQGQRFYIQQAEAKRLGQHIHSTYTLQANQMVLQEGVCAQGESSLLTQGSTHACPKSLVPVSAVSLCSNSPVGGLTHSPLAMHPLIYQADTNYISSYLTQI